jgi:hypothetical protein
MAARDCDSNNINDVDYNNIDNKNETYRLSSEQLFETIEQTDKDTPIVVDFDETLWLRNSTEFFLASLKPSLWVSLVLQIIGLLKPWKILNRTDSSAYRDLYRIKCVLFFIPSAVKQWEKIAAVMGPELVNQALYDQLVRHGTDHVYVASYGFDFIIKPLLNAIDPALNLVVSSTLTHSAELKLEGKASAVKKIIGADALQNAIAITDSMVDIDLLESCRVGALVVWSKAVYTQAGMAPMLPFVYLKKIKRPNENYFSRAIIGHDYLTLLLAFALFNDQPLLCALGMFFFLLAYFCAYEIGYYENDRLGLKYENNPKVSAQFIHYHGAFDPRVAWFTSMVLALIGSVIVVDNVSIIPAYIGVTGVPAVFSIFFSFMAFLVSVRLVFAWFNRIQVKGRIVPMLFLQLARTTGYIFFFSTSLAGELLCVSLGFAKWIPYLVYRFGGDRQGFPSHLISFIIFTTFMLVFAYGDNINFSRLFDTQAIIIFLYLLFRATKDIWSFRHNMKTLYHD